MRRLAMALLLFASTGYTAARQPSLTKGDRDRIEGTWRIVGLESGGKQQAKNSFRWNTFTFARVDGADTATLKEWLYPEVKFGFSLNEATNPRTIDLSLRNTRAPGIYKLDGDDLTICVGLGGLRPTEFATRPGGDTEIFTLKRVPLEHYSDLKRLGFAVDFPGKTAETKRDIDLPSGKITTRIVSAHSELDRADFSVMVIPLASGPDGTHADERLDAARAVVLAAMEPPEGASVESGRPVTTLPPGVTAGREFTITSRPPQSRDRTATRIRLYLSGERVYALLVSGPDDVVRSPIAAPFWTSFRTTIEKKEIPKK